MYMGLRVASDFFLEECELSEACKQWKAENQRLHVFFSSHTGFLINHFGSLAQIRGVRCNLGQEESGNDTRWS